VCVLWCWHAHSVRVPETERKTNHGDSASQQEAADLSAGIKYTDHAGHGLRLELFLKGPCCFFYSHISACPDTMRAFWSCFMHGMYSASTHVTWVMCIVQELMLKYGVLSCLPRSSRCMPSPLLANAFASAYPNHSCTSCSLGTEREGSTEGKHHSRGGSRRCRARGAPTSNQICMTSEICSWCKQTRALISHSSNPQGLFTQARKSFHGIIVAFLFWAVLGCLNYLYWYRFTLSHCTVLWFYCWFIV